MFINMKMQTRIILISALVCSAALLCDGRIFAFFGIRENPIRAIMNSTGISKVHETGYSTGKKSGLVSTYVSDSPYKALLEAFINDIPDCRLVFDTGEMALLETDGAPSFSWLLIAGSSAGRTVIFQLASNSEVQKKKRQAIPSYPESKEIFNVELSHGSSLMVAESNDDQRSIQFFYETEFSLQGMSLLSPSAPEPDGTMIYAGPDNVCIVAVSKNKKNNTSRIAVLHKSRINK